MRATVIYYSVYGNTQEAAMAIAAALREDGGEAGDVRTLPLSELDPTRLGDAGLLVMGAPTHKMNLPEAVRDALDALPRKALADMPYAAFDTSYEMSRWLQPFTAAHKLDKRLRGLGGKRIAPPETFRIEHSHEGPLLDGELERARAWGRALRTGR